MASQPARPFDEAKKLAEFAATAAASDPLAGAILASFRRDWRGLSAAATLDVSRAIELGCAAAAALPSGAAPPRLLGAWQRGIVAAVTLREPLPRCLVRASLAAVASADGERATGEA